LSSRNVFAGNWFCYLKTIEDGAIEDAAMGDGGMDDGTMEEGGIEGGGFFSTTLTLIRLLPSFSNQSMYSLNKDMLPVKRG